MPEIDEEKNRVVRHSRLELVEHWAVALSGLVLLLSGMFELPMAARYRITSLPGMAWSGDFITSLAVHYAASVLFIAAAAFHLVYHGAQREAGLLPRRGDIAASIAVIKSFFGRGEEPPFGKYLPEQRLAYAGMAAVIAGLILSGLVKTYKNLYAPDLPHGVVLWATWVHNLFFILFILAFIAHIAALLLKPNRPMVRGIFTGAVRLDYARHRHPLWLAGTEMTPVPGAAPGPEAAPAVALEEERAAITSGGEIPSPPAVGTTQTASAPSPPAEAASRMPEKPADAKATNQEPDR
jgi:cytochrome b subunit of formate dehydrogenase